MMFFKSHSQVVRFVAVSVAAFSAVISGLPVYAQNNNNNSNSSTTRRSLSTSGASVSNTRNAASSNSSTPNRNTQSSNQNRNNQSNQQNQNRNNQSNQQNQNRNNQQNQQNRGNQQGQGQNRGGQPGAAAAPSANAAGSGQLRMVDKTMIEVLRTRKVDYDETVAAASPSVIILNSRVLNPERSLVERESALVRQTSDLALMREAIKIPDDLFAFLGELD